MRASQFFKENFSSFFKYFFIGIKHKLCIGVF